MATSGPNQGGTAAEVADGFIGWTNPGNAVVDNDSYATVAMQADPPALTNRKDYTNFPAFTGVAAGDVVTHVKVEVALKVSSGTVSIGNVQLIKGGVPVGTAKDLVGVTSSSTSEVYLSTGDISVSSDFITTLAGSELTSTFGVRVQFLAADGSFTLSVDAVRVTVTGTFTAGPWKVEAIGVFQGGAVEMGSHQGGAAADGVFQGGAVEGGAFQGGAVKSGVFQGGADIAKGVSGR